ncbi:MAG: hypothetical protein N2578_07545, partial [Bdellovibrionaceae bacterium]|nr:hypothetical protein [Pseudobdellovibrionaceae bacterium]
NKVVNLAGRLTIEEMVTVIRESRLVISNDSAPIYIAAALQVDSICILGGGHPERFATYPPNLPHKAPTLVFHQMDCYGCNWRWKFDRPANSPVPCIENITLDSVWNAVCEKLRLPV